MRLTEVRLDHFRNLASTSLRIPPPGALLVGENGQGKTNFLEAIHFLARHRSFRGTSYSDAIAFDADHFRVEGGIEYEDGRSRRVAVAADRSDRRLVVDGHEAVRAAADGAVHTVVVAPADLELVAGSPAVRRRYLDDLLTASSRSYARSRRAYDRALRQRNELLRSRHRPPAGLLETWDEALVDAGAPVIAARARLAAELAGRFEEAAAAIGGAGGRTGFGLAYRVSAGLASGDPPDVDAVGVAFRTALRDRREADHARGWTTAGPHRDDLALSLRGRDLGRFGSQGEQRTAAIALRLLEAERLEADTGHPPILLLDDAFTELDAGRAGRLVARLGDRNQRFVTTPRPVPPVADGVAVWRVEGGRIHPAEAA